MHRGFIKVHKEPRHTVWTFIAGNLARYDSKEYLQRYRSCSVSFANRKEEISRINLI